MKKTILLILLIAATVKSYSQSYPNIDFEFGSLTYWQCSTGKCCPINTLIPSSPLPSRHEITNIGSIDPYTLLPTVRPNGGLHSLKLGNNYTGSEAERVSYTFTVTPQTRILTLYYQAVLENGHHAIADQPRFEVNMVDSGYIPIACSAGILFPIPPTGPYPANWHASPIDSFIHYSDWTPMSFMLKKYIGHTLTLTISTGDCNFGGHFGYGYFDISTISNCDNGLNSSNNFSLYAPEGMNFYYWDTLSTSSGNMDTTNTLTVAHTDSTNIYYCILGACAHGCGTGPFSFTASCMDTVYYNMSSIYHNIKPQANFTSTSTGLTVSFNDNSNGGSSILTNWNWTFGDGGVSFSQNPSHSYATSGRYQITLMVENANGCRATFIHTIIVLCYPNQLLANFKDSLTQNSILLYPTIYSNAYRSQWQIMSCDSVNFKPTNLLILYSSDSILTIPFSNYQGLLKITHWYNDATNTACIDSVTQYIYCYPTTRDTISGYVWNDVNNNGLLDVAEKNNLHLKNLNLTFSDNTIPNLSFYSPVDSITGYYQFILLNNNVTISLNTPYYNPNQPNNFYEQIYPIAPLTYNLKSTGAINVNNINFGITNNIFSISGKAFYDADLDGFYSTGENVCINAQVLSNSILKATTNINGNYNFNLLYLGNYNIATLHNPAWYISSTPLSIANISPLNYNFDISLAPSTVNYPDGAVNLNPITPLAWNRQPSFKLLMNNEGNQNFTGSMVLKYPTGLNFINATHNGVDNASAHTITWNYSGIKAGGSELDSVNFNYPTALPIGSIAHFYLTLYPVGADSNTTNNIDSVQEIVLASYDPNVKTATPVSDASSHLIEGFDELAYTIQFQNTGNAPAVNIIVVDTLNANFDIHSFHFLYSSYEPCEIKIDSATNIVRFILNSILLPDSMHNEPASHGLVSFSIKPISKPIDGNIYTNTGYIYFDNNAAVVTNTAIHKIGKSLGIKELKNAFEVKVYPNPMTDKSTVKISEFNNQPLQLQITDISGRLIQLLSTENGEFVIEKKNLSSGTYNLILVANEKIIATEKLIIK